MSMFRVLKLIVQLLVCFIIHLHVAMTTPSNTPQHIVYINSVDGQDTPDCLTANSFNVPCRSLNWALRPPSRTNDTEYVLAEGTHCLNETIEPFVFMKNITFNGNGSTYDDTVVSCTAAEGTGLSFNFSTGIHFAHLSFINCSNKLETTNESVWFGSHAALFFNNCENVHMNSVRVGASPHSTGVVMMNTIGSNYITDSLLDENAWRGIHVQLKPEHITNGYDIAYRIHNTMFRNNSALEHDFTVSRDATSNVQSCLPFQRYHQAHNYGGGMSLVLQNTSGVSFVISNSTFIYNKAVCGGGLFVALEYSAINSSIHLSHSTFENNACPYFNDNMVSFGGGIRLEHLVSDSKFYETWSPSNKIYIDNCRISNNLAFGGGGLSVHPIAQDTHIDNRLLELRIRNTEFLNNQASVGAAIEVTLFLFEIGGRLPLVLVSDSEFIQNRITSSYPMGSHKPPYQIGVGAVYTNKVPIIFRNNVKFFSNVGSALAVAGTYVDFSKCTATFANNHGGSGGGLALLGAAGVMIDENTTMNFTGNHASLSGGAIHIKYIEKENLAAYSNCFVRHKKSFKQARVLNATFYFIDNDAVVSGQSIFATSIFPCALNVKSSLSNILCLDNWHYFKNDVRVNCSTEISTEPGSIRLRKNEKIRVSPGEVFELGLDIFDDLINIISKETVLAAHKPLSEHENASVDPNYNYISNQELVVNGQVGTNLKVHLSTTGERSWHVNLDIELVDCPPAFILSSSNDTSNSQCDCSDTENKFKGTVKCNKALLESYIQNGYWIGKLENDSLSNSSHEYVVSLCPPRYCNKDNKTHVKIPREGKTSLDEVMCGNGLKRSGILCGECINDYAPAVNSDTFQCVRCDGASIAINVVRYASAVYIPLFILFTCIVIFNVRLTTGPANAFIFYSQIISSNFNLNADGHIPWNLFTNSPEALEKAYKAPYGIFNLEFIENFLTPFCLSPNLNTLDVLQLDYIVAASPLIMIIIVLLCFKLRRCCQPCVKATPEQVATTTKTLLVRLRSGESLLHVFAAFVLLSYTIDGLPSSYIAMVNPVFNAAGHPVGHKRVYFAGQYSANDSVYILRYCIPAYIVFTIIALPPLFLLGYPVIWFEKCLIRVPCLWKLYPAGKVQILLDTFQGCYKDKMRFFAGVYFLFRFVINISYMFTYDWTERFIIQQIICILFVVIFALCQPYRKEKWIYNYVDSLIFTNLAIINTINLYLYNYIQAKPGQDVPIVAFYIQYVLVFLPLVYMVVYTVWRLLRSYKKKKLKRLIISKLSFVHKLRESESTRGEPTDDLNIQESLESSSTKRGRLHVPTWSEVRIDESTEYNAARSEDETLFVRARSRNTYKAGRKNELTTNKLKEQDSAHDYTRDSGLHTRGQSCTNSRSVPDSQLTPLVNDGSPVHVKYSSM